MDVETGVTMVGLLTAWEIVKWGVRTKVSEHLRRTKLTEETRAKAREEEKQLQTRIGMDIHRDLVNQNYKEKQRAVEIILTAQAEAGQLQHVALMFLRIPAVQKSRLNRKKLLETVEDPASKAKMDIQWLAKLEKVRTNVPGWVQVYLEKETWEAWEEYINFVVMVHAQLLFENLPEEIPGQETNALAEGRHAVWFMDETMRKKLESIYSVEEWERLPQQAGSHADTARKLAKELMKAVEKEVSAAGYAKHAAKSAEELLAKGE